MRTLAAIIIASLFATPGLAHEPPREVQRPPRDWTYTGVGRPPHRPLREIVLPRKCGESCVCRGCCRCVPVRTTNGASFRQQLFIDAVGAGLVDQLDRRFRDGLQLDDERLLLELLR